MAAKRRKTKRLPTDEEASEKDIAILFGFFLLLYLYFISLIDAIAVFLSVYGLMSVVGDILIAGLSTEIKVAVSVFAVTIFMLVESELNYMELRNNLNRYSQLEMKKRKRKNERVVE